MVVVGALLTALVLLAPLTIGVLMVRGTTRATEIGVRRGKPPEPPALLPFDPGEPILSFDLDEPEPEDR